MATEVSGLPIISREVKSRAQIEVASKDSAAASNAIWVALLSVFVATTVGVLLVPFLAHRNICMLYLLAVIYVSSKYDWFPSLLTSILSLLAFRYFIAPPRFSFFPLDVQVLITFSVVMLVSVVVSRRTLQINRLAGSLEEQVQIRTGELEHAIQQLSLEVESRIKNELVQQQTLNELAARNATLEHFAKLTVHDLREPLRTVTGYLSLLRKRHSSHLTPEVLAFLEQVDGGIERMERLINGIGELARLNSSSAPFRLLSAGELVNEALLNLASELQRKNASVQVSQSLSSRRIFCDCQQLVHVFQNLISNAIKFCKDQPHIQIDCDVNNEALVFSITDNGIGIEDKYKSKLFHPFQRLHSRKDYPGVGLGLVLCQKIVQNHGGKLWFESNTSIGTTFFFSIPAFTDAQGGSYVQKSDSNSIS